MKIRFKIYFITIVTLLFGILGFIFITKSLGDHYYIYRKKQFLKKQENFIKQGKKEVLETVFIGEVTIKDSLAGFNNEVREKVFGHKNSWKYKVWYSPDDLDHIKRGYSVSKIFYQEELNLAFLMRVITFEGRYYVLKTNIPSVKENFNFARELNTITFIIIMSILSIIFIIYSRILARQIDDIKLNLNHIKHRDFEKIKTIDSADEVGEISRLIAEVGEETRKNLIHFQGKAEEQKEFLRNFGHEIKTPLTIANGYTDILKRKSPDNNHLKIISKELVRISRITRMFQEFSAGKKELFLEEVPLADLLNIGRIFAENNSSINYREFLKTLENSRIICDVELVESLFYNLYSNAFNYCREEVKTLLHKKEDYLLLTIANDTSAAPEKDISRLWNPFYRGSDTPKAKGTGLGLSIVRDIASKHNWNITLKNSEGLFQVAIEIPFKS